MASRTLNEAELADLELAHRECADRGMVDRVKAVILLGEGWSAVDMSEALLLDRGTVWGDFHRFEKSGVEKLSHLEYRGRQSSLDNSQQRTLIRELEREIYASTAEVIAFIQNRWGVFYSERGANSLLHRLEFDSKTTKAVPGKAGAQAQEASVEQNHELKAQQPAEVPIYFAHAVHHQHNTQAAYSWVRRGEERTVPSNTGFQRANINGALAVQSLLAVVQLEPNVDAQASIRLFQALEEKHPEASRIVAICDNARYYRARIVRKHLKYPRIQIVFLPPYAPCLNLSERLWKFFTKTGLDNRYYERVKQCQFACDRFFRNLGDYRSQLKSLLTEDFEVLGSGSGNDLPRDYWLCGC